MIRLFKEKKGLLEISKNSPGMFQQIRKPVERLQYHRIFSNIAGLTLSPMPGSCSSVALTFHQIHSSRIGCALTGPAMEQMLDLHTRTVKQQNY